MSPWLANASFYARQVLAIAVLWLALWGYGAAALRRLAMASLAERTALRWGVGAVVASALVFVLGLTGGLARPWLFGVVALGVILAVAHAPRQIAFRGFPGRLAVAALLVAPIALQVFYPPVDWDATSYHLAVAKLDLASHHVMVTRYLRYPVFPQFQEMLFTMALGTFGDVAAHGTTFLAWVGTALALLAAGTRLGAKTAGVMAAALWIGSPTALAFGTVGYVDVPLTFFVTLAGLCWIVYAREPRRRWAALAGLFAGAAGATKYSGLFFIAAFAVAMGLASPPGRRLRSVALFAGLAALICLPWYARNFIVSGDPLFPFLGQVFPNRFWNAGDLAAQMSDLQRQASHSWRDFLLLWGRLAFNQGIFVGPEDVFSPALWIPLPILLWARWKSVPERALLLIALAFVCLWFFGSPSGRYLLPAIPFLCLGMGGTLASLIGGFTTRFRVALPVTLVALVLALPGAQYAWARTRARGFPPVTQADRDAFITRTYATYPLYLWLADHIDGNRRIYAWRDSPLAYYSPGTFLGDWFGPARYAAVESALPDPGRLHEVLRSLGADYFVVPDANGPVDLGLAEGDPFAVIVLVHSGPGGRIFRIEDPAALPPKL